jgi:hypothetical protein
MNAPFAASRFVVPVVVVTMGELPALPTGTALITMDDTSHNHSGGECLACNTQGNVRVRLFELLEQSRAGVVRPFSAVVVDARHADDPQAVMDALVPGKLPAFGLRDHTVGRSFRLA